MTRSQLQKVINDNNRRITSQRDLRASAIIFDLARKVCKIKGWEMTEFFKEVR
jgi:hypothetical protein